MFFAVTLNMCATIQARSPAFFSLAATAIAMSCDHVLTDDKHIKQIKETKTKWI
jgi:hypothetical protein